MWLDFFFIICTKLPNCSKRWMTLRKYITVNLSAEHWWRRLSSSGPNKWFIRNGSDPMPPPAWINQEQALSGSPIFKRADPSKNCLEWQFQSHQVLSNRTYSCICMCWQDASRNSWNVDTAHPGHNNWAFILTYIGKEQID